MLILTEYGKPGLGAALCKSFMFTREKKLFDVLSRRVYCHFIHQTQLNLISKSVRELLLHSGACYMDIIA